MTFPKNIAAFDNNAKVEFDQELMFYDRPILFSLKTERGLEIAILIDETEVETGRVCGDDIFASVLITEDDLQAVLKSQKDLRSVYEGVEGVRLFVWTKVGIRYQNFDGTLPEEYLSEKGAYLDLNINDAPDDVTP